jgi:3-deoxy-D-manno-octulosonic-acid transferase
MTDALWRLVYIVFVVPALYAYFLVAALFSKKVRVGMAGRRRLFRDLENGLAPYRGKKLVWTHASSLGEFEQAKPIIETLKKRDDVAVLATFFSPSGYRNSLKYGAVDYVSYLPFDTTFNARRFSKIVRPDAALIIRYDIWPNHVWRLWKDGVPLLLAAATMRRDAARKSAPARGFHRRLFSKFDRILTVSEEDRENFREFEEEGVEITAVGDTRYDRVYQRASQARERRRLPERFVEGKRVLVFGSLWREDDAVVLAPALKALERFDDLRLVLVPHEPTERYVERLERECAARGTVRFTEIETVADERVVVVDTIGELASLYQYASIAFIGGSFRENVHNVLEAAVFGVPTIYGPKIKRSQEAERLAEEGGGLVVKTRADTYRALLTLLENERRREWASEVSRRFVEERRGAAAKIVKIVESYLDRDASR